MDIQECLPKTAMYIMSITIDNVIFDIHQTKQKIYVPYHKELHSKRIDNPHDFLMKADKRREFLQDFCSELLKGNKTYRVIDLSK